MLRRLSNKLKQSERRKMSRNNYTRSLGASSVWSAGLAGLVIMAGVFWCILVWAHTPVVYYSVATGECAEVFDVDGMYSCETMPKKYTKGYVE